MPLPVVAVEVAPADAPPTLAEALLSSCSSALRRGSCQPAGGLEQGQSASATAVVVWAADDASVRVEVGVKREERPSWTVRQLSFAAEDARVERWRAAGLTVASLVGEIEQQREAAPARPPRPPAPVDEPPPRLVGPTVRTAPTPRGWLGLAAIVGPGLSTGTARVGARAEGGVALFPLAYGLLTLEHAIGVADPAGVDVSWTTFGAGGLYSRELGTSGVGLGGSARVLVQRTQASVDVSGQSAAGSQWDPALAFGVRATWPESSTWALATGVDVWRLWRGARVEVRNEEVGRSSGWGGSAWVGIQWTPAFSELQEAAW